MKNAWIKEQLEEDGWSGIEEEDIASVLNGNQEYDDVLIDVIFDLSQEWDVD